jgi:hypothetical protein
MTPRHPATKIKKSTQSKNKELHCLTIYINQFYQKQLKFISFIQEICTILIKYNMISESVTTDAFRPIRFQYQKIVHALFNQYRLLPQLKYHAGGNGGLAAAHMSGVKIHRSRSSDSLRENECAAAAANDRNDADMRMMSGADWKSGHHLNDETSAAFKYGQQNGIKSDILFSNRYQSDFNEIGEIASGGFGSVFKVIFSKIIISKIGLAIFRRLRRFDLFKMHHFNNNQFRVFSAIAKALFC